MILLANIGCTQFVLLCLVCEAIDQLLCGLVLFQALALSINNCAAAYGLLEKI